LDVSHAFVVPYEGVKPSILSRLLKLPLMDGATSFSCLQGGRRRKWL